MKTEPVGFKGTPGRFVYGEKWHMEYTITDKAGFNVLNGKSVSLPSAEANAKIMVASKKMAIALQNINDEVNSCGLHLHGRNPLSEKLNKIQSEAKEALKEAGI